MPTIFRDKSFRFVIYPNDHEPAHVHVLKGDVNLRIKLSLDESPVEVLSIQGDIRSKDIEWAVSVVSEKNALFLSKWIEIHG